MQVFLSMLVLFFAVFALIDGGLITWQARGGARARGVLLLILGIVCLGLFLDGTLGVLGILEQWGTGSVTTGVFALAGALIGLAIPTALLIVAILV